MSTFLEATPMMQQWHQLKAKAKDALLLFRLGDFYEAFYDDAIVISKEIHLTLTKRQDIPMCGVPEHALDAYLDKLIGKGFKIAIAEQMEDPKFVKGLVKREIVRFISPGTLIQSSLLSDKTNNYIVALSQIGKIWGGCSLDLSTSEMAVFEVETKDELLDEIFRLKPKEILVSEKCREQHQILFQDLSHSLAFILDIEKNHRFDPAKAEEFLISHFQVKTLDIRDKIAAVSAAGALLYYLKEEMQIDIASIRQLKVEHLQNYMALDRATLHHLDIVPLPQQKKWNLTELLDKTETAMGGRLLQHFVKYPLLCLSSISKRQDAVQELTQKPELLLKLKTYLSPIRDIERILVKVQQGYASPKDLIALKDSLEVSKHLKESLTCTSALLQEDREKIGDPSKITQIIERAIVPDPPLRLTDGRVFKIGFHAELDEWRKIADSSKDWVNSYQTQLRDAHGIKTLKVGFTKAFGYYIEISRGQSEKAPASFQRRQTLINTERYVTDELKEFELKILSAEDKISSLQNQLFEELKKEISSFSNQIMQLSMGIARIDVLYSLALSALEYKYVRPVIDESDVLKISKGRHPIIERALPKGTFVVNDVDLSTKERLYLITGPNMAGKSTFIRQVALIAIMAQIGSFVPAESAHIGIIDRVFSRIGASDDLARGHSTFMVEMTETAQILQNATNRSLVILDEIGRGTSTFDGIAIAWAVAEYLLITEGKKAKTLFATHYSELTEMEGKIPGAVNYQIAVEESPTGIHFLRKIMRGGTDKSYGIHVAKLAGLPFSVIKQAENMLLSLEKDNRKEVKIKKEVQQQLPLFPSVVQEIKKLDLNKMTPFEALLYLQKLQQEIQ